MDPITATGRTDPIQIKGGIYSVRVKGTWGGTSLNIQFTNIGETAESDWQSLPDTDENIVFSDNIAFTAALPEGLIAFNLTGGSGIDLQPSVDKIQ